MIWTDPATLNTYLNDEYYSNLEQTSQQKIISHNWSIGEVIWYNYDNLINLIADENSNTWSGNIGLINYSDYLRANTNVEQCETNGLNNDNHSICKNTNWLFINENYWTINAAYYGKTIGITYISSEGNSYYTSSNVTNIAPRPTLYLSSDIKIVSGTGTETDAYQIEL